MDTNVKQAVGTTAENRVRRQENVSPISVTRVYDSGFQKEGTETAELKQTVETKSFYPTKSVSSDLQDNIYATADFGFSEQEFTSNSTRVAWIDVPKGFTVEQVVGQLAKFPEARIMRVLSNRPILSDNQMYAINNPALDLTLDMIADRQVVRYPDNHEVVELRGKLILDNNGKPQYKGNFFRTSAVADEDRRNAVADDFYVSDAIKAELAASGVEVPGSHGAVNEGLIPSQKN